MPSPSPVGGKAVRCSVETPPSPDSDLHPLPPRAARCFLSLLSPQQLPLLFFFCLAGRDIFCPWLLLLETGVPVCLRYLEILDKREFFFFQAPFFFYLRFCHLTLWGLELCLSSKLPVNPGNSEENVEKSDLGRCACPLSLLLVCR